MKKRWKILIIIAVLLLVVISFHHIYYSVQFNRRITALAEEGELVSFSDLDKMDALPQDLPNAADAYMQAFSHYQKPDELLEPLLPCQGSYEMSDLPFPKEVEDAMALSLQANAQTLVFLDQGATIEYCVYPRERPFDMEKQELFVSLKNCGWLLCERNLYLAQMNQTEELFDAMLTLLKFSESPIRQGMLIDEMIAFALKNMAVRNLEHVLRQVTFTDAQLFHLQQQFCNIQDLKGGYRGFLKERIYFLECILSPFDERPEKPDTLNRWRERVYLY